MKSQSDVVKFLDDYMSLPSRERGLKYSHGQHDGTCPRSLPSRERGLKCEKKNIGTVGGAVAPFAGAWIEIRKTSLTRLYLFGRSLRGSVD